MFSVIQKGDRIAFNCKRLDRTVTRTVQGILANCCVVKHGGEFTSVMKSDITSLVPKGKVLR